MQIAIAIVYALCLLGLGGFVLFILRYEDFEKRGHNPDGIAVVSGIVGIIAAIALGILALKK